MENKALAITQPYLFPYLNYFHLLEASDKVIFYDDINYIKGGWINRNRILNKDRDLLITIPVQKGSQNRTTHETLTLIDEKLVSKTLNQLKHSYSKAPYYLNVIELINKSFNKSHTSIADLAINCIEEVYNYLELELKYDRSSVCSPHSKVMGKSDRLISISKEQGYKNYVNVIWGQDIHNKEYFESKGINLFYLESLPTVYKQFNNQFIPNLSIIDVLMFNDINTIKDFLKLYRTI